MVVVVVALAAVVVAAVVVAAVAVAVVAVVALAPCSASPYRELESKAQCMQQAALHSSAALHPFGPEIPDVPVCE